MTVFQDAQAQDPRLTYTPNVPGPKPSILRLMQENFSLRISELEIWAHTHGMPVVRGDAFRDPKLHGEIGEKKGYGHPKSCHKLKLAQDLYLRNTKDEATYHKLHDQWDKMGGAPRIPHDLNHFSFDYGGCR